jgi:hypothetical protein
MCMEVCALNLDSSERHLASVEPLLLMPQAKTLGCENIWLHFHHTSLALCLLPEQQNPVLGTVRIRLLFDFTFFRNFVRWVTFENKG